jgi:hypothetical protein
VDTLTFGPDATVAVVGFPLLSTPHNLTLSGNEATSQIINHGTIEVRTGGGIGTGGGGITISVKEFHNHGLVSAHGKEGGFTGCDSTLWGVL